jgi:hypothetical protein
VRATPLRRGDANSTPNDSPAARKKIVFQCELHGTAWRRGAINLVSGDEAAARTQDRGNRSYVSQRIMSAVVFALLWTAGMLWWFYPEPAVMHPDLLAGAGVLIGLFWYWMHMKLWHNIE